MNMRVEVVYVFPRICYSVEVEIEEGGTVADAVRAAMFSEPFRSLRAVPPPDANKVGIFGRAVTPDTRVSDGDRVEFYRDLAQDPRGLRRQRATEPPDLGR